jgi:sorting nexin-14
MMNRFDETNNESIDCFDDVSCQLNHEYEKLPQNGNSDMFEYSFSCDDRLKDLSAWRVSIPSVDSRVDINGREYDFFLINVQRLDVQQEETFDFSWTVERRYNEFYVLESKLKEFHGQKLSEICLPPKRSFVKLSKPFMEYRRPEFEKFLKQLLGSAQLKGSELVYNFLRSSEEFTTGFLPDIKIGKMIKTVPAKFSKERGQHLEPFLLSFISSTEQMKPKPVKNEISELLEYSPSEFAMASLHKALYQNMGQWNENYITDNEISKSETSSERLYAQLDFVYDYILFFLIRFYNLNNWFLKFLFMFRPLFRKTLQSMSEWYLRTKLKKSLLVPQRMVELIHLLRDSLYFEKDLPPRTSQQKKQRSQLALKYAKEFIPNWIVVNILGKERHEEVIFLLFSIFQYPLLNKQLLYLIFDIIVKELFPEILLSNINISQNSNLVEQK